MYPRSFILNTMATIQNSSLTKELVDGAKITTSYEQVPTQLADKVVPVMEVNPKLLRRCNYTKSGSKLTTGGITALALPTGKDFYLCNLEVQINKDATCDVATGVWNTSGVIDGVTSVLCSIPMLTLTAQTTSIIKNFVPPLKLDKDSTITSSTTAHTAGLFTKSFTIVGYSVD